MSSNNILMKTEEKAELNISKLSDIPIESIEKFLVDTMTLYVEDSRGMEYNILTKYWNHKMRSVCITTSNLDYKAIRIEMDVLNIYISRQNGRGIFEPITHLDLYSEMLDYGF